MSRGLREVWVPFSGRVGHFACGVDFIPYFQGKSFFILSLFLRSVFY